MNRIVNSYKIINIIAIAGAVVMCLCLVSLCVVILFQ